jgi:hypothetical protein
MNTRPRKPLATSVARDLAARFERTSGMRRTLVALVSLIALAALAAPTATAKEEFWVRICDENGCKLVKDRIVAAALSTEAEEFGTRVRASPGVPVYSVSYAAPDSGHPTGPTHWLAARSIEFTIRSSQASVSDLLVRATTGIRPFAPTSHESNHWQWFTAGGGAGAAILASTLLPFRRSTRANRSR